MRDRSIANVLRSLCVWLSFAVGVGSPALAQDSSFIRGDCNADGTYNIADPISMLGILFSGAPAPLCNDACDCNDDGSLDIGDAICMLSGLFGSPAVPPAAPHPNCGPDPTADALGCASFEICGMPPVALFVADPTNGTAPLEVFFDASDSFDPDGTIVSYAWDFGDGQTGSGIFPTHTYSSLGNFTVTLTVTDESSDTDTATTMITTDAVGPPVMLESTSPTNGEDGVAVTRETIIRFDSQVQATTLTNASIYAQFSGVNLPTTVHVPPGALVSQVTLFYAMPLPGSSVITVFVDGDLVLDALGRAVDADEDGVEGGLGSFQFSTLSLTLLSGTAVCGRVFASEFDDMVGGQPVNVPLAGVTITIDGIDPGTVSAVTDELGSYRLEPVPPGTFFVHVDGRTVASALIGGVRTPTVFPAGPYYPFVGKPFTSVANQETQLPDIFLPLVDAGTLVTVSDTDDTVICFPPDVVALFPELDGVCITVPAGSLYADDGTPGGMVGISPVNPDRLPGPLPPGLEFALVITVQTNGPTNFNVPAPICFPNLPDPVTGLTLQPGDESALWSFNHDTGQWEVAGPMTVTADGTQICTNPGVGILAPGWHAVNPGVPVNGGDLTDPDAPDREVPDAFGQEPISDDGDAAAACKQGRKVYLHNGEENLERVDLFIPGRGEIDFVMRRRYRSRFEFAGPIGYGWDFDYNDTIQTLPNGNLKRCNGRGRVVTWEKITADTYQSPTGHFRTVRRTPAQVIEMRSPNGFRRLYRPDGRLAAHIDRFGNRMVFEYDAFGDLELVVDPYGREIRFEFAFQPGGFRRLSKIRDFLGREVHYTYDNRGDLVEVRTPVVTGTPTNNDFPDGRTERYTYSFGFLVPQLNHNILSATFANEVANGGPPAITWEYGNNFADQASFDRVIREHLGGGLTNSSGVPAGGTMEFEYEHLNVGAPPGQPDLPRGKVLVTERNGNQYEYFVNEFDHHIITRRLTRGLRVGEPAFFETRMYYDSDGQLTRTVHPEGNEERFVYDTAGNRGAQKNLIETRKIADVDRGGGEDLVTRMTYEPLFNQLRTKVDPRGNATNFVPPIGSASAARYTTRYFFDYQEGSTTSILNLATELGVELDPDGPGPMTALSVAADLSLGMDLNSDAITNQRQGSVVRVEHPSVTRLEINGSTSNQAIITESQWNKYGQPTRIIDPEGNVQVEERFPLNRPAGVRTYSSLLVPLNSQDQAGYLQTRITDAETSNRRTTAVPPAQLETRYSYDEVGNQLTVRNPRGVVSTTVYNALNEPVVITRGSSVSAAVSSGELITGEPARAYLTRHFYDANGNVVRTEVENRDSNTAGVGAFIEHEFEYDLLNNRVEERVEVDSSTTLTTQFRYDENENRTLVIRPEGNRLGTTYDERDLVFTQTRGVGTALAATTRHDYDGNANLVRVVDAQDNDGNGSGESSLCVYDGFDRKITDIDNLGNEDRYTYDVASNIVRRSRFGHPAGNPGGALVRLTENFSDVDELNRTFQIDADLFLAAGFTTLDPVILADGNSDGLVSTRTIWDALSRQEAVIDDDLEVTEMVYDGASRVVEAIDAAGNRTLTTYDANSNAVQVTRIEVSPDGLVADEVFETYNVFDQYDRLVRSTDNAGQTTRFEYDSRDNLVRQNDAQGDSVPDAMGLFPGLINDPGNRCVLHYDGLDRVVRKDCELRIGGSGSGAIDTSNPNNPDGLVTVRFMYDGNSRLVGREDDNGNVTTFEYDALDRQTLATNDDGTETSFAYDRDDNLVQVIDPNGSVVTTTYDANDRPLQVAVIRGPGVGGTTLETYQYDGVNRITRTTDNNGGSPQECEFVYDSLTRVVEERQNGAAVSRVYAGDGDVLTIRYPGPREITLTYDAIDRPTLLADGGGTIAAYSWIGPDTRALLRVSGNGAVETYLNAAGDVDVGYDAVQRVVSHRTTLPGGATAVDRAYSYNRANLRTSEVRNDDFGLTDSVLYDSTYRVTAASYDQNGSVGAVPRDLLSRLYQLDGVGNRRLLTEQTTSTGTSMELYSVNSMNEYTAIGGSPQDHDDNGNRTSDGSREYVYDYKDRLVRVTEVGGDLLAEYRYFSNNLRAEKRTYGAVVPNQLDRATAFYYLAGCVVEERDALTDQVSSTYVWDPRYQDCLIEEQRTAAHPQGAAQYYVHQNVRFDVVAVTDAAGGLVESFVYDEFGAPSGPSATALAYRFQGGRYDPETGFYYLRRRYYDSEVGRFIQRDPVWDEGNVGNQYTFVGNSPLSRFDPEGLNQNGRRLSDERRRGIEEQIQIQRDLIAKQKEIMSGFDKFFGTGPGWDIMYGAAIEIKRLQGLLDNRDYVGELRQTLNNALNSPTGIAGRLIADPYTTVVLGQSAMSFEHVSAEERILTAGLALGGVALSSLRHVDDVGDLGRMRRIGQADNVPDVPKTPHKNSLDYVGETHVYRVKGPDGTTYKIGESAQGVRVRDGASIRAEQQARRLTRETGDVYTTEIRKVFPDKASARQYETRLIERFRRMFGLDTLPGNKTNR
ncbi:MAG: PKD domain-containing protein [Planctomycetota bacterium]